SPPGAGPSARWKAPAAPPSAPTPTSRKAACISAPKCSAPTGRAAGRAQARSPPLPTWPKPTFPPPAPSVSISAARSRPWPAIKRSRSRAVTPIRRVWVTRAEPGAARTADRLTALGFEPVVVPLLTLAPLPGALNAAPPPDAVAVLALTSPNGVEAFAPLIPRFRDHPVFAVGDATAKAARAAGFADVRSASGDIH